MICLLKKKRTKFTITMIKEQIIILIAILNILLANLKQKKC